MAKKKTESLTSPKGGKRGCLCDDGKYRAECCTWEFQNQGIGNIDTTTTMQITNVNGARVNVTTH